MNDSASNAISRAPTNPITQTSENLIQSNRHSNISLPLSLLLYLPPCLKIRKEQERKKDTETERGGGGGRKEGRKEEKTRPISTQMNTSPANSD